MFGKRRLGGERVESVMGHGVGNLYGVTFGGSMEEN